MAFWNWSQTASSNGSADPSVNFLEGQAPSSVNDSARALMAVLRKWGDDISGTIVTSGTSTAFTVASNSSYDSFAHLNGQMIAFSPHTTNGATVTLSVDGLGAKPLRSAPNTELLAGTIIQGTPYLAVFNNSDSAFYLQGFVGNPYNVPLLGGMDFWDTIAPNSSFIFPAGQAISRTTYATAFARWGTAFGAGNGSTTFNVPDKTGRVSAMLESVATRLTATYFGGNSLALGAVGGAESHTLAITEMPSHNHNFNDPGHTHTTNGTYPQSGAGGGNVPTSGSSDGFTAVTVNSASTGITLNAQGGGNPHVIVQPTIVCNYIIRII